MDRTIMMYSLLFVVGCGAIPVTEPGATQPILVDDSTGEANLFLLDTDSDGIADGNELLLGTNPLFADTDGDGIDDPVELLSGTNPRDPTDPHLSPVSLYVLRSGCPSASDDWIAGTVALNDYDWHSSVTFEERLDLNRLACGGGISTCVLCLDPICLLCWDVITEFVYHVVH